MILDDKTREAIALKKFSIIAPVLNGQVDNQKNYFTELCMSKVDLPYYGARNYTPKTLQYWLSSYLKEGIDALKPGYRSDKGKHRKIDMSIIDKVKEKRLKHPNMPVKLIYETLSAEGVISSDKVSLPTFYRFMEDLYISKTIVPEAEEKDMKRFSHEYINELWQTDIMYGPYIKYGKSKKQTYLLAYIDDASRLCTHAQFYYAQNFEALRSSFKEAILKRGIPRMLFTDNGKIYRSQQLEYICASIGCVLIHAKPFTPQSKGKIERLFHTVRSRFLAALDTSNVNSIDELNIRFWKWLENDYHRKIHSSLDKSPLDFFMSQVSRIKISENIELLNESFLMRISRKVSHDATLQIDSVLYETEQKFAGMRLEIRYDPEWLNNPHTPILLYKDGTKIGEAHIVNFHDNAHIKRKYNKSSRKQEASSIPTEKSKDATESPELKSTKSIISYSSIIGKGDEN